MTSLRLRFLTLGVLGVSCCSGFAQLVCDQPVFDFHSISSTQTICHVFLLRNTNDSPVAIDRIQSSCGCTKTHIERMIIPGKESEPLELCFNAKGRQGAQNRYVHLAYGGAEQRMTLRLSMTGTVYQAIEYEPAQVRFTAIAPTGTVSQTVRFFSPASNTFFRITGVTIPNTAITHRLETVAEGYDYRLIVEAPEPRTEGSNLSTAATVTTDHPEFTVVRIPILMRISRNPNAAPAVRRPQKYKVRIIEPRYGDDEAGEALVPETDTPEAATP
jgi:hypothetical protein